MVTESANQDSGNCDIEQHEEEKYEQRSAETKLFDGGIGQHGEYTSQNEKSDLLAADVKSNSEGNGFTMALEKDYLKTEENVNVQQLDQKVENSPEMDEKLKMIEVEADKLRGEMEEKERLRSRGRIWTKSMEVEETREDEYVKEITQTHQNVNELKEQQDQDKSVTLSKEESYQEDDKELEGNQRNDERMLQEKDEMEEINREENQISGQTDKRMTDTEEGTQHERIRQGKLEHKETSDVLSEEEINIGHQSGNASEAQILKIDNNNEPEYIRKETKRYEKQDEVKEESKDSERELRREVNELENCEEENLVPVNNEHLVQESTNKPNDSDVSSLTVKSKIQLLSTKSDTVSKPKKEQQKVVKPMKVGDRSWIKQHEEPPEKRRLAGGNKNTIEERSATVFELKKRLDREAERLKEEKDSEHKKREMEIERLRKQRSEGGKKVWSPRGYEKKTEVNKLFTCHRISKFDTCV